MDAAAVRRAVLLGCLGLSLVVSARAECTECDNARAGCPQQVAPRARPSNTRAYDGYYVGGSAALCGDGPCAPAEGTWGWDYYGLFWQRRVDLGWLHGRRAAQVTPQYKTDGPKILHKD